MQIQELNKEIEKNENKKISLDKVFKFVNNYTFVSKVDELDMSNKPYPISIEPKQKPKQEQELERELEQELEERESEQKLQTQNIQRQQEDEQYIKYEKTKLNSNPSAMADRQDSMVGIRSS